MISLIAIVGADLNIGPSGGLPVFANPAQHVELAARANQMVEDGIVVVGSNTARIMAKNGVELKLLGGYCQHAIWSRKYKVSPEDFLTSLEVTGKRVFICGGATTFRIFMPYVENFFLWRAHLISPPDYRLDPIFPGWTNTLGSDKPSRMI